jgi:flagellar M-ring protein FliF
MQVVKANENNTQKSSAAPASVEQNLPEAEANATTGPETSSESDRKEETTNYEMNSKRIATVSNGYSLTKMSISLVVNQQRLATILGQNATPEQVSQRIAEIQKVVASAAGFNEARGDMINVSAVEFIDGLDGVEVEQPGLLDWLGGQAGTMINALAFVVVAFLVAWFGLKPMVASLSKPATPALPSFEDVRASLPLPDPSVAALPGNTRDALPGATHAPNAVDDLRHKIKPGPQERLARMVEINEERSAQILRKWTAVEAA